MISIDFEDWFHLEYFKNNSCDKSQSIVNKGTKKFIEILKNQKIKATFFVVGELISKHKKLLQQILNDGHEISGHSLKHKRPTTQTLDDFEIESKILIDLLNNELNIKNPGYRAPCFSLDNKRLEILEKLNYSYDSSKILAGFHPLYGDININEFKRLSNNIYKKNQFIEFELPTISFFNIKIPISGGGYLRILPWFLFKYFLKKYLRENDTYFFFIHPFELINDNIKLPKETSLLTKFRFKMGRSLAADRFKKLLIILKNENFEFITFSQFRKELIK